MAVAKDFKEYDIVVGDACIKAVNERMWIFPGGEITTSRSYAEMKAGRIDRFIKRSKQRG